MKSTTLPPLEVADIFREYRHLLGNISPQKNKVINAIINCRTIVLGGHKLKCTDCDHFENFYNSCRNRFCPKCQYLSKMKWIEKRMDDLLPCEYFHVVFTIPFELRSIFLSNKKTCYDFLFKMASETLKEVSEDPKNFGAKIGFIGVLHTWTQDLLNHPHVHFIVPAGGLNKKKTKWITSKKDYFLEVKILSDVFQGKMIKGLEKLYSKDKLSFSQATEDLTCPNIFQGYLVELATKDWVVYAKPTFAGPSQVINYLGGYTHRIAISNYRLIKIEEEKVYFYCRDRDNPGQKIIVSLHVLEFMRRFLLHLLPTGYVRIRHYGLLGSRLKNEMIELIRKINGIVEEVKEKLKDKLKESWIESLERHTGADIRKCPKCSMGKLVEVYEFPNILNTA